MNARHHSPREILVRTARSEALEDPVLAARARAILGAGERQTLVGIDARARRDYLAVRVLARTLLAEVVGCDPSRLEFHPSPLGRPEVVTPPGAPPVRLSLSHADGVVLCAVGVGDVVGAEVESRHNVGPHLFDVASAVCSAEEMSVLRRLPVGQCAERFLYAWTVKEAVAKAAGRGLRMPFRCILVRGEPHAPSLEFDSESTADTRRWRVASWRLPPCHFAAVATPIAAGDEVEFRMQVNGPLLPARSSHSRLRPWRRLASS